MSESLTVQEGAVIEIQEIQEDKITQCYTENSEYAELLGAIQEIKKHKDVVGYILKSDSNATVDLDDSTKLIDYAMLSSQTFDAARSLSEIFKIGDSESILIEGKNLKVICLDLGKNKISIFMEKSCDHFGILRALIPQLSS